MKFKALYIFSFVFFAITFWNCNNSQKSDKAVSLNAEEQELYLQKGMEVASSTFRALSAQLQKTLKEGGVSNAIQYCNLSAYSITDSLSLAHDAEIKRTSLKTRNPDNAPTDLEKEILLDYADQLASGQRPQAKVTYLEINTVGFYAPIFMSEFCLNCHGKIGQSISNTDFEIIRKHYPSDQATGYSSGDLRGMWSIRFTK